MEYKKIKPEINNFVNDNLRALEQLFPNVVKDGEVDFEALKEELGEFKEVEQEKYEFTWTGKQEAKKIAQTDVVNRTLKYIPKDSKDANTTENLYIEGDNLEVLKLLRQNYYGSIKMIYIDPPYNTDNDFIYNDSFKMATDENEIAEGFVSSDGERLQKVSKTSNRYHANWLNMMYPRLKIAKDLLKDDGVIFISIDDIELSNLKKICDEIFGENNFISNIIWQKKFARQNDATYFSTMHDNILCYAKQVKHNKTDDNGFDMKLLPRTEEDNTNYKNPDNDPRGLWISVDFSAKSGTESLKYEIETPGGMKYLPSDGRYWRTTKENLKKLIDDNRIWFGSDGKNRPRLKTFLSEVQNGMVPNSIWFHHEVSHTQASKQNLKKLFDGKSTFDTPKPVELLYRIAYLSTKDNDIVLDFFSGSCATAHAVMQLNADDRGNRKFIMIQIPEETDVKSEAYKNGYTNICEIGKERIRRAGEKIKEECLENNKSIPDIGFKVFRTSNTNIKWNLENPTLNLFDCDIDNIDFTEDFNDIDVVYEIMLHQKDVPLYETIDTLSDIGNRTYLYASSYLICLEKEITNEMIEKLATLEPLPLKFVFRDSAFKDDLNLKDETFRRLNSLIERNSSNKITTYTVEFI